MSFGFGVGDIIAVSKLATKVYQGLSGAPEEYKKCASHVLSLESILKQLAETTRKTPLSPSDTETLANLTKGCNDTLLELQKIIDKYESVGKRRFSRTMNYLGVALTDNTDLHQTLITQLGLLSNFQMGLSNRGQARIERALLTISKQIQQGQRPGSVLGSTVIGNEEEEMDDIWSRIENELVDEGVEKKEISENKVFIFDWVQRALAAGDLDEKGPDVQPEWGLSTRTRTPSPSAEITTREKLEALNLRINSLSPENLGPGRVPPPAEPADVTPQAEPIRPPSSSSHRSQSSTWRHTDGPDNDYVQQLLLRLAKPEAKVLNDNASRQLLMKRAFYQLDWKDEGGLLRQQVVDAWKPVIQQAAPKFPQGRLVVIARTGDTNRDGVIDFAEFLKVSEKIVDEVESIHEAEMQVMIHEAVRKAYKDEKRDLDRLRQANPSQALLPWGWEFVAPKYFRDKVSGITTESMPQIEFFRTNLSWMAYIGAPRSLNRIYRLSDDYRLLCSTEKVTPDPAIIEALAVVRTAALKFTLLENPLDTETGDSDLEQSYEECSVVHAVDCENDILEGCPIKAINDIFDIYSNLLAYILSFLKPLDDAYTTMDDSNKIGMIRQIYQEIWPMKRMETVARLIAAQLSAWDEIEKSVETSRTWFTSKQPALGKLALELAKTANKTKQEKMFKKAATRQKIEETLFPEQIELNIRVVAASGLASKRTALGRKVVCSPFAEVTSLFSKDEKFKTKIVSKNAAPKWNEEFHKISLRARQGRAIEICLYDSGASPPYEQGSKSFLGRAELEITDRNSGYGYRAKKWSEWYIKEMSLLSPLPEVCEFPFSWGGEGSVTVEFKFNGLIHEVLALGLPMGDYLASLAPDKAEFCAKLFPEAARELQETRAKKSEKPKPEPNTAAALFRKPKGWKLRGIPEKDYVAVTKPLPSYVEKKTMPNGRDYFVNHNLKETSWAMLPEWGEA